MHSITRVCLFLLCLLPFLVNAQTKPTTEGGESCGPGAVTLLASGAESGNFRWYASATGGSPIPAATSSTYTTPILEVTTTYYVSIISGQSESERVPVTATIKPIPPAPSFASIQNFCLGSTPTSFTVGVGTYRWYTAASGGEPLAQMPTVNTSTVGTIEYFVSELVNGCESSRLKLTVNVVPKPVVNAGEDRTYCLNEPVTLIGQSPTGGKWTGRGVSEGGAFNTGIAGIGTHELTYTVTQNGCSISDTRTIEVIKSPSSPGQIIGPNLLCVGAQMVSYSVPNDPAVNSYQWTIPMGWVIVAGQGTHSIKVDTGYGPGLITVRAGNMCGYSDEITLAINTSLASQVTLSPFTKAVCSGNSNYVLTGGAPAGGTYAGKGVVNGVFNAVLAGPGYHTITYSLINNCFGSAARQIYVGTCLGVKESILSLATEVYPNPASQQITVTVPFIGINTVTVKLVNSQGKEMFTQYYKSYKGSFKETLSVSGLAKGLYLFHVNTNSEVIVKRVLVH